MHLTLSETDAIHYLHHAPSRAGAPILRDQGFGTLSWNFRSQAESRFDPDLESKHPA